MQQARHIRPITRSGVTHDFDKTTIYPLEQMTIYRSDVAIADKMIVMRLMLPIKLNSFTRLILLKKYEKKESNLEYSTIGIRPIFYHFSLYDSAVS